MGSAQNFVSISRRPPDIEDYVDMLRRYRSWIIGPMFAGLVISVVVAFLWPDTYISYAVMRITPQQIPDRLVPSAINSQIAERLQQMQTEILSRGSLSEIIQKPSLDLYKKERARLPMEDIVQQMRNKDIRIQPIADPGNMGGGSRRYASAFQISFSYTDRYKAQAVVRELVTKFTEQNVTVLRNQASLTTNFLGEELKAAKEKMDAANASLTKFKIENQGRLPEQAQANYQSMQMLQMNLMNLNQNLNRVQSEKTLLETQLQNLKAKQNAETANLESSVTVAGQPVVVRNQQLINLDNQIAEATSVLAALKEIDGEKHPDVLKQQAAIAALLKHKAELERQLPPPQANQAPTTVRVVNPQVQKVLEDLRAEQNITQAQITSKQGEIEQVLRQRSELERQLAAYQKRLEEAPLNEQQYASLLNEVNLAKQNYEEMVKKHEDSQTAQNLEEHKAGENLEVLDTASLPEQAAEPKRAVWAAMGIMAGLALGIVLAAAKEMKDASLKNLKDVRAYTNLPVLSSIPLLENALLVRRKRRLVWLAWSSAIIVGCILMSGSVYYHMSSL